MQTTLKPSTVFCYDNLPVMRGINSNSIDLIYLDPPFNKGKNFHAPIGTSSEGAEFSDIWSPDDVKDEWHNQINDLHPNLYKYLDAVGAIGSRSAKYYLIYMAIRLLEIRRILKPTGSVYLHCDPTASHYLKLLMDTIFGHRQFRNEIVWHYKGSAMTAASRVFPRKHDILLLYSKSNKYMFSLPRAEVLSDAMLARWGDKVDGNNNVLWGKIKHEPGQVKKHKAKLTKKLGRAPRDTDIAWTAKASLIRSVWTDIAEVRNHKKYKESIGYPTQKPLALLERIITASSNKGDMVLDPFCGCATACIAAERLGRQWVGIDVSIKAKELVKMRLEEEVPADLIRRKPIFRNDLPSRTDVPHKAKPTKKDKQMLYGMQDGKCKGCTVRFDIRHFHIDHIVPVSQGGSSEQSNLQLLCGSCNNIKGARPMEYLKARVKQFYS